MRRWVLLLIPVWMVSVGICFTGAAFAGSVLRVVPDIEAYDLAAYVSSMEDAEGLLTIEQILTLENSPQWRTNDKPTVNVGYTRSDWWFRLELLNDQDAPQDRLIELDYPVLDEIDVYTITPDGRVNHLKMGDKQPFQDRPFQFRNFIFPVHLVPDSPLKIFLRVNSGSSIQMPLTLWNEKSLTAKNMNESMILGICLGIMLIMAIYNLFVYLSVREVSYFFYVFFLLSMTLLLSGIRGIGFQYLWPNSLEWNDQSIVVGLAGAIFFGSFFTRSFTNLPENRPFFSKFLLCLAAIAGLTIICSFLLPYILMIQWVIGIALITILGGTIIGIIRWIDGDIPARYFMLAWSAIMVGGVILAANKFNLIARNLFTENAVVYGMGLQAILLSLALAERLNIEKQNSLEAQMKAYEQERIARMAQEKALDIQKRANEMLEHRVRERTIDLERANKKLESLSITDGLTGIKNRRFFNAVYPREFKRAIREKSSLACLLLDIDYFKNFNDTYGHLIGDDCLKMVASLIEHEIKRVGDMAFRYGGEEFAVLLPNTEAAGALGIAEKIRSRIEASAFKFEGREIPVTISIGLAARIPVKGMSEATLLGYADAALYQSKQNGRNRVTIYAPPDSQQ
ncbi:MAG: diguanylate cyclase [Desulfobacteraceae bacterium]|nr:MAG: diguanylate cyclase [Desulfobacteraceae bacterium]